MMTLAICCFTLSAILLAVGPQIHNTVGTGFQSAGGVFLGLALLFWWLGKQS